MGGVTATSEIEPWWPGATIYQVYVRSFADSDGDGYGDLPGVTARLDYLAWLGVDAIWLSPTMPSPDQDWGYDVQDYVSVHPDLGNLGDLDQLIAGAGARGIRVLLDLVPNHTSAQHAWFLDARSSVSSVHRDWYVWSDPKEGGPPNNWRDATGAPAWTLDPTTGQYYLHNFLEAQPDLNWWNPQVHEAFREIIGFWLDRGVAGFRIDVAHGLYKDAELRNDPPAPPATGAAFGLAGVYSRNRPETHAVYRDWRKQVDGYNPPRLLMGETWVLDPAVMAGYYGCNDELQLALNFAFLFSDLGAEPLASVVERTLEALPAGACPVWAASNHDDSRFPTRWAADDGPKARLGLTILCTLPGTTVLYYGDELGLGDVEVPDALQRDQMSWHGKAVRVNRDVARTPMPWEPVSGYGFSGPDVTPWLPLGDRSGMTVGEQRDLPSSTLNLCRTLIRLKHRDLGYERLSAPAGVWAYRSGRLTVAANFSAHEQTMLLPDGVALSSLTGLTSPAPPPVLLPWEALVVQR